MGQNDQRPNDRMAGSDPLAPAYAPRSFELLAELCPDGVLVIQDGSVVYASAAANNLLGSASADPLPGRPLMPLVAPAHRARLGERLARAEAGASTPLEETTLRHAGGGQLEVELACGPFYWAGRPAAQLLIHDIAERKATATRLQASDNRLATELEEMNRLQELSRRLLATRDLPGALNEVLDAAIVLLDADYGNIQLYNPHKDGLEIVVQRGFPQAFLDTFALVRVGDDSACGRALRSGERIVIEDVLTDEEYLSFRDIAAASGYRAVQSTPLLAPGGEVLGMLSTHFRSPHRPSAHQLRMLDLYACQAIELVDRLRAEQALRATEVRFRRALQPRNVGIVFINVAGVIHEANDAFLAMSGFSRADLLPHGLHWEQMTPQEWREDAGRVIAEFAATGTVVPREHEFVRKDGSRWYALCSATRIADDEGVGYLIDITGRKRAEQALKEADRRKDEFLATLAHELRNPLAPISNAVYLLRANGQHRRHADQLIEMVQRQVRHIVRLVDDLLELSRITRGKIELRRAPLALADILHAALEANRPLVERAGQRLHVHLPADALMLDADSVRLTQVFSNLLNNASRYTARGGDIWLEARREDTEAVVTVRDSGIGIAPDMLPRVFDMFVQGEPAASSNQGGLGIGLTMARSLVALHDGAIEARSEGPGRGSEFIVRLPLLPQRGAAPAPQPDAPATLNGRRLLVVDDNHDAADSLALLLEASGAEVRVAYGGTQALAVLADWQPQAAVIDIGMPGMDGYELAERIRHDARHAGLRLVALTGWGQREDRLKSSACGFDAHLTKPADLDALCALLAG